MLSYDADGLILNVLLLELRMVRTEVAGCVTRVLPSRKEAQCLMTETEAKQKKTILCTTTIPKTHNQTKADQKRNSVECRKPPKVRWQRLIHSLA